MKSQVSIIKCPDYDPIHVFAAVKTALDLQGGLSNFIRPGSKVLVKPNLLMAKEPDAAITTHPEVVRAAIRLLKEINCKIIVGDSPSVFGDEIENVDDVYAATGITKICAEEGVELIKLDKRRMRRNMALTTLLDECDHIVSIPKLKTHNLTIMTGAIKNLFGLVVGTYKIEMHRNFFAVKDFSRALVDIYEEVRPSLTIVDAVTALEGDGPASAGKKRQTNLILAGKDCVALDSVLARVMGVSPFDVLTTKEAAGRALGVADEQAIEILGEKLKDVIGEPFQLPVTSIKTRFIPKPVLNLIWRFIRYRPHWLDDKCTRCSACVKACPKEIVKLKNGRIVCEYSECIACFCCQEVCAQAAIKVKKSLLAKIVGL